MNKWHFYAAIVTNILDLISRDWSVALEHTLRKGNASADFLAKFGAQESTSWTLHDTFLLGLGICSLLMQLVFPI